MGDRSLEYHDHLRLQRTGTADESHPDQRRRLQQPDDGLELLDGKLKARSDDGVPVGQAVFLVDNTDKQNTEEVNTRDADSPD